MMQVRQLLQIAKDVSKSVDPRSSCWHQIVQFCDAVSLASHDHLRSSHCGNDETAFINVSTIHQAKGLEFDIVYLPGLIEGAMPLAPR